MLSLAYSGLWERKTRSLLTIIGIAIGTAAIVALLSETQGLHHGVMVQINRMGATTIMLLPSSSSLKLTDADVTRIRMIKGAARAIPFLSRPVTIWSGSKSTKATLIGINQEDLFSILNGLEVEEGTPISPFDTTGIALGHELAYSSGSQTLFARMWQSITVEYAESAEGTLIFRKKTFRVQCIFEEYGASAFITVDSGAFIPLRSAKLFFESGAYYDGVIVLADRPEDVDRVVSELEGIYGDNARIIASQQVLECVKAIMAQIELFLMSIGMISLVVAGVGIANTMFVSVIERTKEIGILKALGYRNRTIMAIFLCEALLMGIIGGIIGIGLGWGLSYVIPQFFSKSVPHERRLGLKVNIELSPQLTPDLPPLAILFSLAVSVAAGLYPAWKAGRLDPVEALRYE